MTDLYLDFWIKTKINDLLELFLTN